MNELATQSERRYRMRGIGAACRSFNLSRADRLDIASVLFDRNLATFKHLTLVELRQAWFAFVGAVYVAKTLMDRRARNDHPAHYVTRDEFDALAAVHDEPLCDYYDVYHPSLALIEGARTRLAEKERQRERVS